VAGWFRERKRLLFGTLGVIATLFLVVAVLPPLLAGGEDSENEVRTTLLQALAGLVLVAGLYFTYQTYGLNRQGQVTERFTRAIDQLGKRGSLEVQLGGIYALERIAWDSKEDHGPIMEVLTAYVREHAPLQPAKSGSEPEPGEARSTPPTQGEVPNRNVVRSDIQAILTVLGRRKIGPDRPERPLDLSRTNLQDAVLVKANLQDAHLYGANLQGAHLDEANLRDARLGEANLRDAIFYEADLQGAVLFKANLQGADLRGAKNLERAFLKGANLQGADLRGANLQGANLVEAILQGANLVGANLQGAHLAGANLQGADLRGANLQRARLAEANLHGAAVDSRTKTDVDLRSLGARLPE
jgi:uncharacterized protein YjbI with pentapeptide repeats